MEIQERLEIDNEPFEIARAADWLDGLIGGGAFPPRVLAVLQVAMEEVLNNILLHGYADLEQHKIALRLDAGPSAVTLHVVDDGIPFDPTTAALPPPPADGELRAGSMGLTLIRRTMDEVVYVRDDDRNHLTLRKFIGP